MARRKEPGRGRTTTMTPPRESRPANEAPRVARRTPSAEVIQRCSQVHYPGYGQGRKPPATNGNPCEPVTGYDPSVMESALALGPRVTESGERLGLPDVRLAHLDEADLAPLTLRNPAVTSRVLELVLGADDRVRVADTTAYPWRTICALRITAQDGSQWSGTGWLAGPRLVVTAGHVVYIHNRGGWVDNVELTPGADGANEPFGSVVSRQFRSVSGWVTNEDTFFDYAAIVLPADSALGSQLGWFGYAALPAQDLQNAFVNLSGYPADKPFLTQWYHARLLSRVEPRLLYYNIDTAGGQSGSPVWTLVNGERFVVGIHTGGALTGNSAVRITESVFDNITVWNQSL